MVQSLPQGPLHRAAGHRHRLRHGGQHRDAGGQLPVGDADAHVPLRLYGGGQRLLLPAPGGDLPPVAAGDRDAAGAVHHAGMVPAGEGRRAGAGVSGLYRSGGAGERAAADPAAAAGLRGGPAEAGQPEHAGRAEQLLQHAGGAYPGGFRGAGPVAGAGGAGLYGLRGHRQLRPAVLRAGVRAEADEDAVPDPGGAVRRVGARRGSRRVGRPAGDDEADPRQRVSVPDLPL